MYLFFTLTVLNASTNAKKYRKGVMVLFILAFRIIFRYPELFTTSKGLDNLKDVLYVHTSPMYSFMCTFNVV